MDYSENPESTIEDFDVYEILGRGGFAQVYRAKSKITGQEVAIKIIDKKLAQESGMTQRVKKEVELHYRLKHPSILELYGFFEDSTYVYFVLELCHNGDLYRKIQENGQLTEDRAQRYLKQVVSGLKYLHKYNILHRDLTLANLLLTKDDKIKISDFGLATELNSCEGNFTMCGTPNYISPEIVSRSRQGLEADIWSVGCILYSMLVGRAPFDTKEIKGTLSRVQKGHFDLPDSLSDNAKDLISGILQTNPSKRLNLYQIAIHRFMQTNKFPELCKEASVTDSGIESMNKGLSLQSKCSLKEPNSTHNEEIRNSLKFCSKIGDNNGKSMELSGVQNYRLFSCSNCSKTNSFQSPKSVVSSDSLPQYHSFPITNADLLLPLSIDTKHHKCELINSVFHTPNKPQLSPSQTTATTTTNLETGIQCKMKPLNSTRLRPIRQKLRNVILNIVDDQSVCLEFLKHLPNSRTQLTDVMCIDSTGRSIVIYFPQCDYDQIDSSDMPHSFRQDYKIETFKLQDIPDKYVKKYNMAKRFVDLVRSKTAKVTFYAKLGKCILMENDPNPDFEFIFYENASVVNAPDQKIQKIHFIGETCISQCFLSDRTVINVDTSTDISTLPVPLVNSLEYFRQCQILSQRVVNSISNTICDSVVDCPYPLVIGKKSSCSISNFYSELIFPTKLQSSMTSDIIQQQSQSSAHFSCKDCTNDIHRCDSSVSAFIPNIGWAMKMPNGELSVQFNDGCQLIIIYNKNTIQKIKWVVNTSDYLSEGIVKEFNKNDVLPDEVHMKIEQLPLFVSTLRQKLSQKPPCQS